MLNLLCLFLLCPASYEVYDCPETDCGLVFAENVDGTYYCAFYDLRREELIEKLDEDKVLVDEDYYKNYGTKIKSIGLMHNKFCTNKDKVLTGTYNPTFNNNQNYLVIINNKQIAKSYFKEWIEIKTKEDSKNSPVTIKTKDFSISTYFCPEDNCEEQVIKQIRKAKESIYFEQFSFTSKPISKEIIIKYLEGIKVSGVFDKRSAATKYSVYSQMEHFGMNVSKYDGDGKLHSKLFIIDNKIWITGSYNPTKNGNEKNDENLVVINNIRNQ